jgi:hypothetical protein
MLQGCVEVFKRPGGADVARQAQPNWSEPMNGESISSSTWIWSDSFSSAPGWLIVVLGVLFVITLVLWVFLPFAIYGTKSILREQNARLLEIEQLVKRALLESKSNPSSETAEQPVNTP